MQDRVEREMPFAWKQAVMPCGVNHVLKIDPVIQIRKLDEEYTLGRNALKVSCGSATHKNMKGIDDDAKIWLTYTLDHVPYSRQ